ncbi:hypothetical protein BDW22DRAFT_1232244 [Trametopsis cervina]|nr:hypothetical protein BDW22DRAFT_1232244 [Trametopsis cervina]
MEGIQARMLACGVTRPDSTEPQCCTAPVWPVSCMDDLLKHMPAMHARLIHTHAHKPTACKTICRMPVRSLPAHTRKFSRAYTRLLAVHTRFVHTHASLYAARTCACKIARRARQIHPHARKPVCCPHSRVQVPARTQDLSVCTQASARTQVPAHITCSRTCPS